MATTTTNFGWDIPQSTDLVKDGATAIAALGQDIDTSMVDLKGGTTGQILSKTSNTDMDFTWINNDQGDITGVTAGTGLTGGGTSGSVTLDFDVANYGGGQNAAGKNKIINGDFGIWQRGTSFTYTASTVIYTADRFKTQIAGTAGTGSITVSQQTFTAGQTDVPNDPTYYLRTTVTTLPTSGTNSDIIQNVEDVRTFAGKTVTLSFYAKASSSKTLEVVIGQEFGSGGSGTVYTSGTLSSTTIGTSWTKYTATFNLPSISGKTIGTGSFLSVYVRVTNPATGLTWDLSSVQLEAGSTATPFQTATGTKQGELAACQRYYTRIGGTSVMYYGMGQGQLTTQALVTIQMPVRMRTTPTFGSATASDFHLRSANSDTNLSAIALDVGQTDVCGLSCTVASGLTQGRAYMLQANANTTNYLEFIAEL